MARRSRPLAAAGAVAFSLLLPATALGAATFQVRNERGVPQSHAKIMRGPHLVGYTDAYGYAHAAAVEVGDQVRVTRDIANFGACAAPEGPWGVDYAVRDARALHTVTLPAVLRQTYQAGLDTEERALLRRINEERQSAGLPWLVASSVLNRTADGYAGHLASTGRLGHCLLASPQVRAWDMGFPGDPVGESIGRAASAEQMLEGWLASPSHRATILQADARSAGIGRIGRTWVAMPSGACLADRCGMTGDRGEDEPQPTDRDAGRARARPWLRVGRPYRRGRVVTVEVELKRGDGIVRMRAIGAGRRPRVRWHVKGSSYRFSVRLRSGRWRLQVRFHGRGRWPDRSRVRRVRIR